MTQKTPHTALPMLRTRPESFPWLGAVLGEQSILTQAQGALAGLKKMSFEGELTIPTNENTILGYAAAVATPEASAVPKDILSLTSRYYQTGTNYLTPLQITYGTARAGSLDGTIGTALITAVSSSKQFNVDTERGTGQMELKNINALVEATLHFTDADGNPLANKEVTDLQLRADGNVHDPLTGTEIKGIPTEGQVAERIESATGELTGEVTIVPTRCLSIVALSQVENGIRAASSRTTDAEGKLKIGFSLLGGVEVPPFSIEATVDGTLYTAKMSTENRTPEAGKCYKFGTIAMQNYNVLNISAGSLGAMSQSDAYALLNKYLAADGTLALSGSPNAADFNYIRPWAKSQNTLKTLDLSATTLMETPAGMMTGVTSLEKAVLPASLTDIGGAAFYGCTALKTVVAPGLKRISADGGSAFMDCRALTQIDLSQVEEVGSEAFVNCTALTANNLPKAATVGAQAFSYCIALKTVNLPVATTVGLKAFWGCIALERICLNEATTLGAQLFWECRALTEITLSATSFVSLDANIFVKFPNIGNATLIVNSAHSVTADGKWQYYIPKDTGIGYDTGELDISGFKCVKDTNGRVLWERMI